MTSLKNCIPKNPFSQNTVRVTQGSCPAGADRDDSYYSTVLSLLVYDNEVRIVVAVGKVDLLRSLAKVKVKMADGMKARGYALGSITFNNYNTEGFTLPVTYNTSKNTKEILFSSSLNAKPSWSQSVTMTNTTIDEESIMLYIPEYDNKGAAADKKASITLNLKCDGMDDGTYTLQFCNYVDGVADPSTLYNIQRNHYYEYTVNKDDRLNVTLKVQKWNKRTHSEIIM